jgi:hypothetical protein
MNFVHLTITVTGSLETPPHLENIIRPDSGLRETEAPANYGLGEKTLLMLAACGAILPLSPS